MKKYFFFVFLLSSFQAEAAFDCRAKIRALIEFLLRDKAPIKHQHKAMALLFEAKSIKASDDFPPTIEANDRTYKEYALKTSSPEEITRYKKLEFASRFVNTAASQAELNIESPSYLLQRKDGTNETNVYISEPQNATPLYGIKEIRKSQRDLIMAKYFGYLCGVKDPLPNTYDLHAIGEKKLVIAKPREALTFENESDEQILSHFGTEALNVILKETKNDKIPWSSLEDSVQQLGLDPHLLQTLKERSDRIRKLIQQRAEASYQNANEILQRGQQLRNAAAENFHPEEIQNIRRKIRDRLDSDIQKNTDFKSFEEYKAFIMKDPVYSQLVQELQSKLQIQLNAPASKRLSILQEGFKSLFETGTSRMATSSDEIQHRHNVISRALGDKTGSPTQLETQYHPKSAYVFNKRAKFDPNNSYGSDHYHLNPNKIAEAASKNRLLCTMTLGDSARMSGLWYGNPVSVEDFPYLAAPFIQQYRDLSGLKDVSILQYRKGIFGLNDVLPHFRNELESKMKIPVRSSGTSLLDYTVGAHLYTPDHIEAQIWGEASPDLIQELSVERQGMPSQILLDSYRMSGIRVRSN